MSGGFENSGLHRFGEAQPFSLPTYTPQNFSAPILPPMRQFAGPSAGLSGGGGGLLGGSGPGGNIGAPDASTNPGLSNSIALGLIGTVLGPAAAMAANSGGIGASAPGGSSAADAPAGIGGLGGVGDTGFAPGDSGDGGGGGGGGGK